MTNPYQRILVTGGAGFIGSNFIRYLLNEEKDCQVINLDALTYAGNLENLQELPDPERHHFVKGDICDQGLVDRLFEEHSFDLVVHFAAESHVDRSISGPEAFIRTNIQGTFSLLEAAKKHWGAGGQGFPEGVLFHHISTDEVYGSLLPDQPAFQETTPYAPNSPYAASKAASDHLVRSYYHTYRMPVTITNCSNNYGPYQFPEKLIPLMILNARQGAALPVYGDGQQVRDWLYVEDHCRAVWQVILKGERGETYNIGGKNQPTNLSIVKEICAILDEKRPDSPHVPHEKLISHVRDRPGHDRRYAMEIHKISSSIGWTPSVSLREGLEKTISWYLDHPGWVETVTKKKEYSAWVKKNYQSREQS